MIPNTRRAMMQTSKFVPSSRSLLLTAGRGQSGRSAVDRFKRRILRFAFGVIPLLSLSPVHAQTAPLTEPISGTTVKVELVPIPAGKVTIADPADPKKTTELLVGPFYMSKTDRQSV